MRSAVVIFFIVVCAVPATARAQDLAAAEAARRGALIAALPADAAKRVFGLQSGPSAEPAQSIGGYAKGCIAGSGTAPAMQPLT